MVRSDTGERELERLDVKNRSPLASKMEVQILEALDKSVRSSTQAVIVLDQVKERNHGVVTDFVRTALSNFAAAHPEMLFFADSRERIGEFKGFIVKPNIYEAARALDRTHNDVFSLEESAQIGIDLAQRTEKPVFLTMGEQGMLVCGKVSVSYVTTIPAHGQIDIVGAGDSATAGIVTALCAGGSPTEAAYLGNLCAAVTIRKLGTTGTASPEEILELLN
jgi:bifunctional ADP-heptose synthase (sugar kinase/adenylyltransferase)